MKTTGSQAGVTPELMWPMNTLRLLHKAEAHSLHAMEMMSLIEANSGSDSRAMNLLHNTL